MVYQHSGAEQIVNQAIAAGKTAAEEKRAELAAKDGEQP